tara:strand:+ start:604 stop:1203 length:600 start_codon:yes stop_codon:yes gene_type:complete
MKTSYKVAPKINDGNNVWKFIKSKSDKQYLNSQIAKDAPKKIDFLILVIETLQINANEALLNEAKSIGLPGEFTNRVQFWKLRCCNPLRKSYTFNSLSPDEIDSFVALISSMAEKLYPLIRQLLSSKESKTLNNERWCLFSSRLKSLIRERMNTQRSYVSSLLIEENNIFFKQLLVILSLSCGPGGAYRLKASMYQKIN